MFSIVAVSHSTFSAGLVKTGQLFMGDPEDITYIGFADEGLIDDVDELKNQVRDAVNAGLEKNGEVLVLTDLRNGSPFNAVIQVQGEMLSQGKDFKHITGINLPTYLEILGLRTFQSLEETLASVEEIRKTSVEDVSDILKGVE